MSTILLKDPRTLTPHPDNKGIPRFVEGMPEWMALFDDIRARGIQEPLRINGRHVIDGETRRNIAVAAGLTEVPVVEVPESEVYVVLLEKLSLQKHLTKGQRAFLLVKHGAKAIAAIKDRQLAALRTGAGRGIADSIGDAQSIEDLCASRGFSKDLYDQAQTLLGIFSGDPKILRARNLENADWKSLAEDWIPKILDLHAPIGLGAALAGIAGQKATNGVAKAPNAETQLDLFSDGVEALNRVAKAYPKLRKEARGELIATWTKIARGWPEDMRREMAAALVATTGASEQ